MSTHIGAKKEDISKKVLICGDPLRSKYIAEKYLENYKLVNDVRGMYGFTGYYKGDRITVMAHGMGIPSCGIYTHELFDEYDVDVMIRIGTAGSYVEELNVNDIVLVTESYSDTVYDEVFNNKDEKITKSTQEVNDLIEEKAKEEGITIKKAKVYTTDNFYTENDISKKMVEEYGCKAVEMESYIVFYNANYFNKKSACLLTISDSFVSDEELSSEDREKKLDDMIKLGLESLSSL